MKVKDPHSRIVPSGLVESICCFIMVSLYCVKAALEVASAYNKIYFRLLLSNLEHYAVTQGEGVPWPRLKALSLSTKFI